MTRNPSGTIFTLCLIAALCADSAPVWVTLALVGIAGLVFLVWGVVGLASGKERKERPPRCSNIEAVTQTRKSSEQSIYRYYGDFRGKSQP